MSRWRGGGRDEGGLRVLQALGRQLTGVPLGYERFADGLAEGAPLSLAAALSAVQGLAGEASWRLWGARRAQAGGPQPRDPQRTCGLALRLLGLLPLPVCLATSDDLQESGPAGASLHPAPLLRTSQGLGTRGGACWGSPRPGYRGQPCWWDAGDALRLGPRGWAGGSVPVCGDLRGSAGSACQGEEWAWVSALTPCSVPSPCTPHSNPPYPQHPPVSPLEPIRALDPSTGASSPSPPLARAPHQDRLLPSWWNSTPRAFHLQLGLAELLDLATRPLASQ